MPTPAYISLSLSPKPLLVFILSLAAYMGWAVNVAFAARGRGTQWQARRHCAWTRQRTMAKPATMTTSFFALPLLPVQRRREKNPAHLLRRYALYRCCPRCWRELSLFACSGAKHAGKLRISAENAYLNDARWRHSPRRMYLYISRTVVLLVCAYSLGVCIMRFSSRRASRRA